jgi:hypothetical protein
MCIFYRLSPLSSLDVSVLLTLSHLFIHMFQHLKHHAAELFSCRCPSLWTFINWIRYLQFYIAIDFAVDFICKCTTLMPWKVFIVGQVDGARDYVLALYYCTPLQAPEASPDFLSLSNIVMLSLSVYVTYSGIGNVNSRLFSLWFEWSIVYHIFVMMSSVYWHPSSCCLLFLLNMDWCIFYVIHCMHS